MSLIMIILIWQAIVSIFSLPNFILPTPWQVAIALFQNYQSIAYNFMITFTETMVGLLSGVVFGCLTAILITNYKPLRTWLLPIMVVSQAIPTFAIAPIIVLWLGFGMSSKIAVTILMVFFPITSNFFDGLRKTPREYLELAHTMQATPLKILTHIRIPAALPSLASGLRIAAVVAPIGAVIGEWVGASKGLGYMMLNANARMQIDIMFAAMVVLMCFTLMLYLSIDTVLNRKFKWQEN